MDIEKYKDDILNIIFERLGKEECIVFLFGTHAQGNAVRSSDVDIGILSNHDIRPDDFVEIEEKLNNEVPFLRKIDLVDFSAVDQKVKEEATKEMIIWHIGRNCRGLLKSLRQV